MKGLRLAAALVLVVCATPTVAGAHDIPADVTIQAFLKPDGHRLRLLMRVPLEAMRDLSVPTRPGTNTGAGSLIDLARLQPLLAGAATVWVVQNIDLYENDAPLPAPSLLDLRVSLPTDRSFGSYEDALRYVTGQRLPDTTDVSWTTGMLDVLLETPISSDRSQISIRPRLARLGVRTVTVLRFVTADGAVRAFQYSGDPGVVRLDPRWYQAAIGFVRLGFFHILDGTDHLLFLFCLVIPFRRFRALVPIVTAFTVAHSVTLIASAYDLAPDALWFPPLIETLIAVSIVYMALENIATSHPSRRWLMTLGFGLVHGFGFSFALRESLQFAGSHLLTSLLSFNVGVELGQLVVLALLVPALDLLFRYVVAERMGTIILSALVA
ncbi:MAG TPA: HupE/UreJ family protein, partial [Vicinamibacterales bacterium]|nr:HupE/UreJ family protein [Vicinamibacterales bacterium]